MNTVHLITHTHWDREWYLPFREFQLKLVSLMDHLLDILKNDQDFMYFLLDGQTIILEDYLQIRPAREADIIDLIKSGRLLIGPWYVSPDEFLIAAESHVRNLLEGDRLCNKYGGKMSVGYLPDNFGHIGQMPQILRGFDIGSACVWRGLADEPCELTWNAPDGSQVLLSYLRDSYSNGASLTTSDESRFSAEIHERSLSLLPYCQSGQMLVMNGTDHMEPPVDVSAAVSQFRSNIYRIKLLHSSLPNYFDKILSYLKQTQDKLPEVTGELRSSKHAPILANILSTRMSLKQRNHACEIDLLKWAEPLNVWCGLNINSPENSDLPAHPISQSKYLSDTQSILNQSWKLLMQCHPHDSICGTSIDQVADEMRIRFDQVDQINHEIIKQSLQHLVDQIDSQYPAYRNPGGIHNIQSSIIIFNPNDRPQSGVVNFNWLHNNKIKAFHIIDEFGEEIPYHQAGGGRRQLISMTLDKKGLQQGLSMIHEGKVAGMVITEFEIQKKDNRGVFQLTISEHGQVDQLQWRQGLIKVEALLADPEVIEYTVHAYSEPEISLSLLASEVPGHGYRLYWIVGDEELNEEFVSQPAKLNPIIRSFLPIITRAASNPIISKLLVRRKEAASKPPYRIENQYFRIEVDEKDGSISILDKRNDRSYSGLNRFYDGGDCGDLYNFCPPEHDSVLTPTVKSVLRDINTLRQILLIDYHFSLPTQLSTDRKSRSPDNVSIGLSSTIVLERGVPRIDIHTEVDNQAKDHRLRAHFPLPFEATQSTHAGHFEYVVRSIGVPSVALSWDEPPRPEVPQKEFTRVSQADFGLTLANRGLPEIEVLINDQNHAEFALTLLRCIGWLSRDDITTRNGHAGPMGIETPGAQMIGRFSFDYSIIPDNNEWRNSINQAYAFTAPLRAVTSPIHPGSLPFTASLVENNAVDFIITTIKYSEDGSGLIVRGFNHTPSPIEVTLKTWKAFKSAQLVNLAEKFIENLSIQKEYQVSFHVDGQKIVTVKFTD